MDYFRTIGGTTISAILGVSPYLSPLGAYLKLRGEAAGDSSNSAIERGIRFEDVVAQTFAAAHPEFVVKHNPEGTDEQLRLTDSTYEFITGSPDRLLYSREGGSNPVCGLEIKTSSMRLRSQWGQFGTDSIPLHYMCQVQWYLGFYPNLPEWFVAVEFFDDEDKPLLYGEYLVKRDNELILKMREAAIDFWENRVLKGVAPECDVVDSTVTEYVRRTWSDDLGTTETADEDQNQLVRDYILAKSEKERAEAVYEAAKTKVQLAMKDASYFQTNFGRISWKKTKDKEVIDYKALCDFLHPKEDVIKKFTSVKEGYRLFNDRSLKLESAN